MMPRTIHNPISRSRRAFSFLEVLVAIAVSLVGIGVLVRVIGLVDHRHRVSRANVAPGSQIRDVMSGLCSDFHRLTASVDPPGGGFGSGYLVCAEVLATDMAFDRASGTASDIRRPRNPNSRSVGDPHDCLAMTVEASGDSPFRGTVPWGVLEAARALSLGDAYSLPDNYDPTSPRITTSQRAEVVHWMSRAMSASDDGDDDMTFDLHRRVLLIRPDLNVTSNGLSAVGLACVGFESLRGDQRVVGFMRRDAVIEPCGFTSALSDAPSGLVGIRVQQSLDLSVASQSNHEPLSESTENAAEWYSANTLEMLRDPNRRFARIGETGGVRREFVLMGHRAGEDVVARGMLSFDLQLFDPNAPVFITAGRDAQPGVSGGDDDGNGTVDDVSELGAMRSDDQIVTPGDPRFDLAVDGSVIAATLSRGAYVGLSAAVQRSYDSETATTQLRSLKISLRGINNATGQVQQLESVIDFRRP